MPQALAARLAIFVATTVATTVVPVMLQDRPVLKWTWKRFGPVVETRVADRINDRINPQVDVDVEIVRPQVPSAPKSYDDGVQCNTPACFDPYRSHSGPVLNPNDYCRRHWWTAGPVRWVVSLPFRIFRR